MFNLAEYRKSPDRLADLLPWAALIESGIVLNKDGSFQRTLQFRGPDLESATESQLVSAMARLNNALKRLGSGWAMYVEASRKPYLSYPEESHFPDPVSLLIDAERREQFASDNGNFESQYYLTFQYMSPAESKSRWSSFLISAANDSKEDSQKSL